MDEPSDERKAEYLAALLPDILNVMERKFARLPPLGLDLLVQAACAWAVKLGMTPEQVKEGVDKHWSSMKDYAEKYMMKIPTPVVVKHDIGSGNDN